MTRAAGKSPSTPTALIVDDEADIRELIEITLLRMGVRTEAAADLAQARTLLAEHRFDFCFTDMRLPDGNGIELVHEVQKHWPGMPIAVITAHGNAQAAVESMKSGAFDFVSKPVDLAMLRKLVEAGLRLKAGDASAAAGGAPTTAADDCGGLLGRDPSIEHLRGMIDRLARSQAPVHICGESGTGKELVARLIHQRGPRAAAAFVPVNCGAIPGELMESEFFGHLKGSFTGALRDKAGLFQAAEGGTLFLDEVADLPLHMQVKLLRALQERRVRQVGSESEMAVNVRIISATHRDLAALVASGAFRQDLYYRLNVIEVRTPPLRERRGDIALLASSILDRLAADSGQRPQLDTAALQETRRLRFPRQCARAGKRAGARDHLVGRPAHRRRRSAAALGRTRRQRRAACASHGAGRCRAEPRRSAAGRTHRGNRKACDPRGAGEIALQQNPGRRATWHELPPAALQAEEARYRLASAPSASRETYKRSSGLRTPFPPRLSTCV